MIETSVLVVDDDRDLLAEIQEGLLSHDISVLCTSSPLGAMDIIENNPAIRILVTDLAMPRLDGIDLLASLCDIRQRRGVLAIVVTGMASLDRAVAALRMGAVDFLQKPIEIGDLAAAIRRALAMSVQRRPAVVALNDPLGQLRALLAMRMDRRRLFPEIAGGETAWDMLLDLAVAQASGQRVSVSALCAGAGTSVTTALRRLEDLEQQGLVERYPDPNDRRRVWLKLSENGHTSVRELGKRFSETLAALI